MEDKEIAKAKINQLEKEIKDILNPYFTSDQKYVIKISKCFSKFDSYVLIKHYNHCGTTVDFEKYVYYNDVFTPVDDSNLQERLDILSNKEYIMQEVENIRQKEEDLQAKKKRILEGE